VFSDNYSDLLKLKGVGGIPQPRLLRFLMKWFLLWTECVSVLSRYFDVETDIALASAKRSLQLGELMPKTILLLFQAIMEFGAMRT
jgi:A/G-specific adenine glycosylase